VLLHSIHEFLYEHRGWVSLFTIPTALIYGRILILGLIADRRKHQPFSSDSSPLPQVPVKVVKPPIRTTPAPDRLLATHDAKGRAVTEVLDTPPQPAPHSRTTATELLPAPEDRHELRPLTRRDPIDAETVSDVFSGNDDSIKPSGPSTDIVRKANRMEELGLHIGISPSDGKTKTPLPEPAAVVEASARQERLSELGLAPAALTSSAPEAAPAPTKPPAPQLDAILAKLDQVLSGEIKAPAEPALAVPTEKKKAEVPLWARADSFDDDVAKEKNNPKQLGLFDKDSDK
jgi:hypothetical protein